jgi:hypothetical protein
MAVAALMLLVPARADERPDPVEALQAELPQEVRAALDRMKGDDRRLLALRSYLRGARSLEARWSWTEAQIEDYFASDASRMALEAVDEVVAAFEQQNPGFSLHVNTRVRSLDEQIEKWNRNASVAAGAEELGEALKLWCEARPKASAAGLRAFLGGWKPMAAVMIAAPGLSPHGRARAFDFQIIKDGSIIAAADTKIIDSVWAKDGWTEKLKRAVKASDAPFKGPLERPYEPWHYEYRG